MTAAKLKREYTFVTDPKEARRLWDRQFEDSQYTCRHGIACFNGGCSIGSRLQVTHLLCGSLLPVWAELTRAVDAAAGYRTNARGDRIKIKPQIRVVHVGACAGRGHVWGDTRARAWRECGSVASRRSTWQWTPGRRRAFVPAPPPPPALRPSSRPRHPAA